MATGKSDIFDELTLEEDKMLADVRVKLKDKMYAKYGQDGLRVVEKYYNLIDGVEDPEDEKSEEDEECGVCRERAERMVAALDFANKATSVFADDNLNGRCERYGNMDNVQKRLEELVEFLDQTIVEDDNKDLVICGVILNLCKRILKE